MLSKILSQVLILEWVDSARRQLKLFIAVGVTHQIQTPVFGLHDSADLSYCIRQWAQVGLNKFECHTKTSSSKEKRTNTIFIPGPVVVGKSASDPVSRKRAQILGSAVCSSLTRLC